ncbi:hypothetical protein JOF41_000292 [Saccharothrix coeruleofusca]|uniref:ABC transporter permease n=1 Tax=Saccharothrix coeruleofusca TaxID=33919 RepID=UPI0027DD5717|nr:ABC transporter permease [Saccharothrix coeruleofusca]MBP2334114.1 hypothetical protein [Saccharothrix coeruleofusca]
MTTTELPVPTSTTSIVARAVGVDNRTTYISFGLAYLLGHGSRAISSGADPLVALPAWLPVALLGSGLGAGTVLATLAATRAQRDADGPEAVTGKLLGASWITAFIGLFLAITGLTAVPGMPDLQSTLWPTGSGFVVGLLYLAEGAARRNVLHYLLGTWLTLISTAALFLATPGTFWVLALAGGGGYALATVLEYRRVAAAR